MNFLLFRTMLRLFAFALYRKINEIVKNHTISFILSRMYNFCIHWFVYIWYFQLSFSTVTLQNFPDRPVSAHNSFKTGRACQIPISGKLLFMFKVLQLLEAGLFASYLNTTLVGDMWAPEKKSYFLMTSTFSQSQLFTSILLL